LVHSDPSVGFVSGVEGLKDGSEQIFGTGIFLYVGKRRLFQKRLSLKKFVYWLLFTIVKMKIQIRTNRML
jgi:hypothetical protein